MLTHFFSGSTWFGAFEGSVEEAHPVKFIIPYVEVFYFPETNFKIQVINKLMGLVLSYISVQKKTLSIKDFFSKCDQIRSCLRTWSHLLKECLMENFSFCAVLHSKIFRRETDRQTFFNINSEHAKLLKKRHPI